MNKNKTIRVENLNAIVANVKADKLIEEIRQKRPEFLAEAVIPNKMQLRKVTLRERAFETPKGCPIYAFSKQISRRIAILVDIKTGIARLCPVSGIVSDTPVEGKFTIDGVTYKLKDTLNGHPRYTSCGASRRPRAKALVKHKVITQVHADRQEALDAYWQEDEPGTTDCGD
ncbi:MAG: hypothetical protein IJ770_00930 [Alphaproteobacteria bacterium]|nr:hypothetical protein [Alphaproteobacteria bacterium]